MLHESMVMMAKNMSTQDIVKMLKEEAQKFSSTNGNNEKQLSFACSMYLLKELFTNDVRTPEELLQEWKDHQRDSDMWNFPKN